MDRIAPKETTWAFCLLNYQKHFSWMWQKIQYFAHKKSFSVFKKAKNSIFQQTKTCFGKFFCHNNEKCFCNHFLIFLKDKMHMLSAKVFVNCKIFKYWIEKTYFFYVHPKKTVFKSQIWSKNLQKNKIVMQQIFFRDFFLYKNLTYRFLRAYWCSQSFFPFWTAYLPWTETLF